jgi:hypothetical protein
VSTEDAEAFLDDALAKGVLKPTKAKKAAAPAKPKGDDEAPVAAKTPAKAAKEKDNKEKVAAKPKAPAKAGGKKS